MKLPRAAVVPVVLAMACLIFRPFDAVDPGGMLNSAVTLGLLALALIVVLRARRR